MEIPVPGNGEHSFKQVEPIGNEERLYRRLSPGGWFKRGQISEIPLKYFMPRRWASEEKPGDHDGLSVNRKNLTTIELAATRPDTNRKQHVAEFGVPDVHRIGLSVAPKPIFPSDLSHAVIPELNSLDQRNPQMEARMQEWAFALRESATIAYVAAKQDQ